MTDPTVHLRFVPDTSLSLRDGVHTGRIPAGVSAKDQLMRLLEDELRFPDYFGRNWDALSDCLRDLSWLPPGRVDLVHEALPALSEGELQTYLEVLTTAAADWKPDEEHALQLVFPERERRRVLDLLGRG